MLGAMGLEPKAARTSPEEGEGGMERRRRWRERIERLVSVLMLAEQPLPYKDLMRLARIYVSGGDLKRMVEQGYFKKEKRGVYSIGPNDLVFTKELEWITKPVPTVAYDAFVILSGMGIKQPDLISEYIRLALGIDISPDLIADWQDGKVPAVPETPVLRAINLARAYEYFIRLDSKAKNDTYRFVEDLLTMGIFVSPELIKHWQRGSQTLAVLRLTSVFPYAAGLLITDVGRGKRLHSVDPLLAHTFSLCWFVTTLKHNPPKPVTWEIPPGAPQYYVACNAFWKNYFLKSGLWKIAALVDPEMFLLGFADGDGSIVIYIAKDGDLYVFIRLTSYKKATLHFIHDLLVRLGYEPEIYGNDVGASLLPGGEIRKGNRFYHEKA